MAGVSVAMIEPLYHVNVGHVARLIKNFGAGGLYLVSPQFDRQEAVKYSTHGKDVLAAAKVVTFDQLRTKFDVLVATTAIKATSRLNVLRTRTRPDDLARLIAESGRQEKFCIVLGRESSGLTNRELQECDLVVTIDTGTEFATLNVAHALAILLHELAKTRRHRIKSAKKKISPASRKEMDLLLRYVSLAATAANYDDHKIPLLLASAKKILTKSSPDVKDVMLLVSLLRRCTLAIERSHAIP